MSILKVSLLQMDCRIADPEYNFLTARSYLEMAAHDKADLAVLPELWASSYALDRVEEFADPLVAEPTPDNTFGRFAALARDMNLTVAGSLLERADDGIYNTMVVYDREGRLLSSYRKVHLVPMLQEEEFLAAGDALSTVALDGHEAGLAICYDLRFPELFQIYTPPGLSHADYVGPVAGSAPIPLAGPGAQPRHREPDLHGGLQRRGRVRQHPVLRPQRRRGSLGRSAGRTPAPRPGVYTVGMRPGGRGRHQAGGAGPGHAEARGLRTGGRTGRGGSAGRRCGLTAAPGCRPDRHGGLQGRGSVRLRFPRLAEQFPAAPLALACLPG